MSSPEAIQVHVAGHELRMKAATHEQPHIQRAALKVTETVQRLGSVAAGSASPTKIATMAAMQFAVELSMADSMLSDAQRLYDELDQQKESVKRLEALLARVDDALAY
ncbi:cell division protein ZapA [Candidatus Sumerlaeota bacterium]|nr:cell division protein ZapA [Candidatus Sumerlaeota bacterium]